MQSPGRERIAEQFAGDLGRDDDRDQHRGGEPEIAGRFQRDERHRQRPADHRRRQRAHADDRIDVRIEVETRPDRVKAGGEQMAAERAQKQRGEKQSAAKAAAERDHRGNRLQHEHAGNDRQRHRDEAGKMQRAMPRRHHLRRQQREQADAETAKRRAQRRPESGLRQQRLAQRHAAHDADADQRRQNPEQRGDGKIAPEDIADRADADAERQRRKSMGDKIARHRGDADRRQAGRRIAPDHQLEGIERAGQRRAERAGDRGRGAAADHDALIGAAQMKSAAQRGGDARWQAGCIPLQARPRRRRRWTRPSATPRSRCRETTSARHAGHWPRSDRFRAPAATAATAGRPRPAAARRGSAPAGRAAARCCTGWKGGP